MRPRFHGSVMAVIPVVLFALMLVGCSVQNNTNGDAADTPFREFISDIGYTSVNEWVDSLGDEEKAMLELAYDTALANGYKGSFGEWTESEIKAHRDADGDLVVVLSDGGQFTLVGSPSNSIAASSSDSQAVDERKASGNNQSKESGSSQVGSASSGASSESAPTSEKGAILSVPIVEAGTDDVVDVPVKIEGNPGILGLEFSVSYDDSALELTSADNGDAFKSVLSMTASRDKSTGCKFVWDGVEISSDDVKDGSVLVMHFKVKPDAQPGFHSVVLRNRTALDNNLEEVVLAYEDGGVVVG